MWYSRYFTISLTHLILPEILRGRKLHIRKLHVVQWERAEVGPELEPKFVGPVSNLLFAPRPILHSLSTLSPARRLTYDDITMPVGKPRKRYWGKKGVRTDKSLRPCLLPLHLGLDVSLHRSSVFHSCWLALLHNSFTQVIVILLSLKGPVEVMCLGTTLHLWSLTLCPCRGKQFFFFKSFSDYHNWIYQLFLSGTLTNTATISPSAMTYHFTNWNITTTWFNEVFEMSCPSIVTIKLVVERHYHCSVPVFLLPIKS